MASLVLFDMFGTLVTYQPDRSQLAYPEAHQLAVSLGYVGDHAEFVEAWDTASTVLDLSAAELHVEYSMTDSAAAFAAHVGLELDLSTVAELGRVFVREWQRHVVPVAGAADMVRRLAGVMQVGVVSNTHDPDVVPMLLAEMGIADVLSPVVLSVDHGRCKPHGSIYAHALALAGIDPVDTVFVGDSYEHDYAAPTRLGMTALHIGNHPGVAREHRLSSVVEAESFVLSGR